MGGLNVEETHHVMSDEIDWRLNIRYWSLYGHMIDWALHKDAVCPYGYKFAHSGSCNHDECWGLIYDACEEATYWANKS